MGDFLKSSTDGQFTDVKPGLDWIPFAKKSPTKMVTRGKYAGGWPKGAVVHYTAGSDKLGSAQPCIELGIRNGYTYLCIDVDGTLLQAHPVSEWGYHAGQSLWKGYVGGLNDEAIGIEICSPGKLTKRPDGVFVTDWGAAVAPSEVHYVTEEEWGCPTGYYKKYSAAQESTLFRTLKWLKNNDPTVDVATHTEGRIFKYENIVGHHECAGMKGLGFWRKQDPGGSLSMPMDTLRRKLLEGKL